MVMETMTTEMSLNWGKPGPQRLSGLMLRVGYCMQVFSMLYGDFLKIDAIKSIRKWCQRCTFNPQIAGLPPGGGFVCTPSLQ